MPRLVVKTFSTEPHEPPAMARDSFDPEEDGINDEVDMVQWIYRKLGPGVYEVVGSIGYRGRFVKLWKGEIDLVGEDLVYLAEQNELDEHTEIVTPTQPRTGQFKKCERPEEDFIPAGVKQGSVMTRR